MFLRKTQELQPWLTINLRLRKVRRHGQVLKYSSGHHPYAWIPGCRAVLARSSIKPKSSTKDCTSFTELSIGPYKRCWELSLQISAQTISIGISNTMYSIRTLSIHVGRSFHGTAISSGKNKATEISAQGG